MQHSSSDTIFALSSAPGRAGVSVFRVSGPKAFHVAKALTGRENWQARRAVLATLKDPETRDFIDDALVLPFFSPASFTGEDVIELQIHGSLAIIEYLAGVLLSLGLRQAEAGEFTRRAFENGKMDLTEAEGLADLIDAETTLQRRQALRQMQGGLKQRYDGWQTDLLDALAFIEGEIDFPDEEDVPPELARQARERIASVSADMQALLSEGQTGEKIRAGLDIAVIGKPNAGKSSLINALIGRDAVIVSEEAGTTRDVVELHMELGGLPVRLSDTAGQRASEDKIEQEGVRRAKARAEAADIRLLVVDSAENSVDPELQAQLRDGDLVLLNKSDVSRETSLDSLDLEFLRISAKTGQGLEDLFLLLSSLIREKFQLSEAPGLTRARHKDCVSRAVEALTRAEHVLTVQPELAGEDVRAALQAIGELSGQFDVEAVLDRIFSSFCIGK